MIRRIRGLCGIGALDEDSHIKQLMLLFSAIQELSVTSCL